LIYSLLTPFSAISEQKHQMTELDILRKPEYIHVVLNHLVIYGTILGALALAVSLILLSRAAQITALTVTLVAAVSACPVLVSGQRAYKTIGSMVDDAGTDALDKNMDRAKKTVGIFYLLALVALTGLLVPIKRPKTSSPLTAVTLGPALICFGLSLYIAQEGGRIRHAEFRPGESSPTPTVSPEKDHHESMARLILIPVLAVVSLTGCTTSLPPLAVDDPASPTAPEAVTPPARYALGTDSATERTRRLIAARAQQDSGTQPQQMKPDMESMPGMQH
jgi:hypothetical protein